MSEKKENQGNDGAAWVCLARGIVIEGPQGAPCCEWCSEAGECRYPRRLGRSVRKRKDVRPRDRVSLRSKGKRVAGSGGGSSGSGRAHPLPYRSGRDDGEELNGSRERSHTETVHNPSGPAATVPPVERSAESPADEVAEDETLADPMIKSREQVELELIEMARQAEAQELADAGGVDLSHSAPAFPAEQQLSPGPEFGSPEISEPLQPELSPDVPAFEVVHPIDEMPGESGLFPESSVDQAGDPLIELPLDPVFPAPLDPLDAPEPPNPPGIG